MSEMTKIQRNLPWASRRLRRVLFVGFPGVQLLDLVGPMEAFDTANRVLAQRGKPPFYALAVGAMQERVVTSSGLQINAVPLASLRERPHTIVIGGRLELMQEGLDGPTLKALRPLVRSAERLVSICTGSFVFGQLGLLDGRRCTTHWLALEALRAKHPEARVEPDAIFTNDGHLYTSAGVTSGIDLALHLIERDLGASLALTVARLLVVFLRRPGGQSQFSASLRLDAGASERMNQLVTRIVESPGGDWRVDRLARRAAMSPRHFARVFTEETGSTPAAFVERVRLEAARRALESGDETMERIAGECGFGTDETMRRVFLRELGVLPKDYRRRFHRGARPRQATSRGAPY